jgi:Protein of unknown function (DUF4232)
MRSVMTRYGHIASRVVAVVAFAGTAALAVALTHAPARPARATLSSTMTSGPCAASGLRAWLGLGSTGASTGTIFTLEFTNVSARTCSLYGYPQVSAYAGSPAAGTQIGSAAVRDTAVRPRSVTLTPGATAHSVLRLAGTDSFQPTACAQVTAPELRVILPEVGQGTMGAQGAKGTRPVFVPIRFPACSRKGPAFLSVQAIQPRPGIPGFTMP